MLQICASMCPAMQHRDIISFEKLAAVVATCRQELRGKMGVSLHPRDVFNLETRESQSEMEDLKHLIQDANMKSWSIWLRGVKCHARSEERPLALGETSEFEDFLSSLPEIRFHGAEMIENRWASFSSLPAISREGSFALLCQLSENDYDFEKYDPPGAS